MGNSDFYFSKSDGLIQGKWRIDWHSVSFFCCALFSNSKYHSTMELAGSRVNPTSCLVHRTGELVMVST